MARSRGAVWFRAATAISTARPQEAGRTGAALYFGSVRAVVIQTSTLFTAPPTTGPFPKRGWYRAATAISTGRHSRAGRAPIANLAAVPCFGSVRAAPTRVFTLLQAIQTMEPIHLRR